MSRGAILLAVGFVGQAMFTARFAVQWLASERRGDSVVPVAFWWLSLAGGATLLGYAIGRREPVFAVGQAMGLVVYVRNLMLLGESRRRPSRASAHSGPHPTRAGVREPSGPR
ncbi:lipid-A-disaccharide synthase N-terminal domain-containing protein [Aquisphaera insulae]|uniref:lipid-A-disaccharide synthase N-terminal domain-containing protein n=1 Tax=Aquisphaera insulae TaxID=2712864 RepID=UPI0013ECEF96|nr:lipid-A-disaccharide synthase N-terminal domain-containing protein [Aquisphaera insulae]